MGKRRQSREWVLKFLYEFELNQNNFEKQVSQFLERNPSSEDVREFASRLIRTTIKYQQEIDGKLKRSCDNWELSRMAVIDRNILRIAACELLYLSTPPGVAIDEAVEIGKKYGGENSPDFINGILDRLKNEITGILPHSSA